MKTLYFENHEDLAISFATEYDDILLHDKLASVSVIAKYEDAKEIIRELIFIGYEINTITDLCDKDCLGYDKEFVISIFDHEIFVQAAYVDGDYLTITKDLVYLVDDCSSRIIPNLDCNRIYEVEIGEYDECHCDGCDYCGTVGCKETPAETVNNDVSLASTYFVNGEKVDKATYEAKEKEFLKEYSDMMDDFNNKLSTLNEVDRLIHNAFRLF